MKRIIFASYMIAVFFLFSACPASAHQPRIVKGDLTTIENPEISQAFYGELKGSENIFKIVAKNPFELYVGLLVPDMQGAQKNIQAEIYTGKESPDMGGSGNGKVQDKRIIAVLQSNEWTRFYEPWGGDSYLKGPEYKSSQGNEPLKGVQMDPGTYFIRVHNPDNQGKYVLVVGSQEKVALVDILNTIEVLPVVKSEFWGKSPLSAFINLTGLSVLGTIVVLLVIFWIFRKIIRGRKKRRSRFFKGDGNDILEG